MRSMDTAGAAPLPGFEAVPAGTARPVRTPDGVAQVVLDVPLAHLDRPFDYAVPPGMAADAQPGARVAVRFAGTEHRGFVVGRSSASEHPGTLTPLRRVVSPLPVLTPAVHRLARAVADRYAGTLADVLRLAVPPRHAAAEAAVLAAVGRARDAAEPGGGDDAASSGPDVAAWLPPWEAYVGGPAFVRRLAAGESPRAVWSALPGEGEHGWAVAVAGAVAATVAGGRGAVVVAPDLRDVQVLTGALEAAGVRHVRLVAEDGPSTRYRAFVRALLGDVRVVVGTRSAAFAPVGELGLVVVWDDGDDLLAEPRAPYPHALQVLRIRADQEGAGALVGAVGRSTATHLLLTDGWARAVAAPRPVVRERTPRVLAPGEPELAAEGPAGAARVPGPAWRLAREALAAGPVLVQVPRAGYVPVTACGTCRAPARCASCGGPVRLGAPGAPPECAWCGRPAADWACPTCGGHAVRAVRVGSARTAEELGRAMPGVPVVVSGGAQEVLATVDGESRLVVATPGAEPRAAGGYTAALLLDAAVTSGRAEVWASEEALRRWFNAAALVRPAGEGGRVMILGHGAPVPVQALVRWDPAGFAERELAERTELAFPPAATLASLDGPLHAVESFLGALTLPDGAEVLGPVPAAPARGAPGPAPEPAAAPVRAIVRVDRIRGGALARALATTSAARTARKEPGSVRVQVDPSSLW